MNRTELAELVRNGESSGVDFKRDDLPPDKLAQIAAAFLNFEGGYILLGIEDDGTVSGLTREARKAEEWVMQLLRDHVQPPVIPFWETIAWDERDRRPKLPFRRIRHPSRGVELLPAARGA